MPKNETNPEDPFELVGVELPASSDAELRDMALCFAEEFARSGWSEEKIKAVFRSPVYQGPYKVWNQKGDEFIHQIITEAMMMWRSQGGRRA